MKNKDPRLDTNRQNHPGPADRVLGDHPNEDLEAGVVTPDGEIAVDGGKLAGHKDDFDGEVEPGRVRPVPGANGPKGSGDGSQSMAPASPANRPGVPPTGR